LNSESCGTATSARQLIAVEILGFSVLAKELGEQPLARKKFDAVLSKLHGLSKLVEKLKALTPPASQTSTG